MQVVLVTGGSGFIGGNFIDFTMGNTLNRVINLDKLTYASREIKADPHRYTFVHGGIENSELVRHILQTHKPSIIVNFAAETHVDRSIQFPDPFVDTNIVGTYNFLKELLRYRETCEFTFVHISTDEVYGELMHMDSAPFTEESPFLPNSPYSATKAASEHLVRAFQKTYDLPAIITNSTNNYGPYQFPEKLIPKTIYNAYRNIPIPVYGTGTNRRDWLYVDDHCRAIWAIINRGRVGERYNIAGNCERTTLDIVQTILSQMDKPDSLIYMAADRPGHDFRYALDTTKIATEVEWWPETSFGIGIEYTIQWYLNNMDWVRSWIK